MSKYFTLIACGCFLLGGCGGGSMPSGSPSVSLSATTLTFGDEVTGTTSQPLTVTLTNSGTAVLSFDTATASANFTETDDCSPTLAMGSHCTITVTFSPAATGTLTGQLSITDDATGSPQTIALSGTGTLGTTEDVLTVNCWGPVAHSNQCGSSADTMHCAAGKVAATPTTIHSCMPPESVLVDTSTSCTFQNGGASGSGHCIVQVISVGSCSVKGQECGASQLPPCCSGLTCTPASTRAFCQ